MKKILNPYLNKEGYNCVCCAPNNPVGLHLEFWEDGEREYFVPEEDWLTYYTKRMDTQGAKKAVLEYQVLAVDADAKRALLKVKLHTGRHHQIRVQLANAGLPILDDAKYSIVCDTKYGIVCDTQDGAVRDTKYGGDSSAGDSFAAVKKNRCAVA